MAAATMPVLLFRPRFFSQRMPGEEGGREGGKEGGNEGGCSERRAL